MGSCYVNEQVALRGCSDKAFMGTTHALSAVALFLMAASFFPLQVYSVLGTQNIWVLVLSMGVMAGAALIPDLDNTASTSKSSLGLLGDGLSLFFRGTSAVIQTVARLPRDDDEPNPHRGFYHTVPACLLMGFLVFKGTSITSGDIELPIFGHVTWGTLIAIIVAWLNIHMALAALAKKFVRRMKNQAGIFGELVAFAFSFALTVATFTQLPHDLNYWWLGVSVAVGSFIHIFGDCFTTAGNPILFPIPFKGKLWWNVRFLPIKAGGVIENWVFVPIFGLICVISFLKLSGVFGLFS